MVDIDEEYPEGKIAQIEAGRWQVTIGEVVIETDDYNDACALSDFYPALAAARSHQIGPDSHEAGQRFIEIADRVARYAPLSDMARRLRHRGEDISSKATKPW